MLRTLEYLNNPYITISLMVSFRIYFVTNKIHEYLKIRCSDTSVFVDYPTENNGWNQKPTKTVEYESVLIRLIVVCTAFKGYD